MTERASDDHDQRLKVLLKEFFEQFLLCRNQAILVDARAQGGGENVPGARLGQKTKDVALVDGVDRRLLVVVACQH